VGAKHRAVVTQAVNAWNTSGIRIRFRPASRSRARVVVRSSPQIGCAGYAQIGYHPGVRQAGVRLGDCGARWPMTQIAAHEFGHILGLGHEQRRCALMNTTVDNGAPNRCTAPSTARYRCRAIERDDLLGAKRLYGGRLRAVGPADCPLFAPPGALSDLSATAAPSWDPSVPAPIRLSYRLPAAPKPAVDDFQRDAGQQVQARAVPGACPAAPAALLTSVFGVGVGSDEWSRVAEQELDTTVAGEQCVAARLVDPLGRTGPVVTTTATVAAPSVAVRIGIAGWPTAGEPLSFTASTDAADVVESRWDFGDPASGAANTATGQGAEHVYAQPGTYTVTNTVRTASGGTGTATRTVTVQAAPVDELPPEEVAGR